MSGFSFPPPPPPPPKAGNSQHASLGQSSDSPNRSRGRVRGGFQRARGAPRGQSFGNPPQYNSTAQANPRQNEFGSNYAGGVPAGPPANWQMTHTQGLPAGAFMNPNFVPRQDGARYSNAHGASISPDQRPNAQKHSSNQHDSPPRTFAGHKRKLEALRGPVQEKKAPPPTAPSVPSFGASLVPATDAVQPAQPTLSKPKGTTNLLGLTPASWDVQHLSSDSDGDEEREVDEEALYAELGDKLTFEHNGVFMSLNSQADLVAWKSERRKNWPTRARMAERDSERRKVGEERKRLLAEAAAVLSSARRRIAKRKVSSAKEPAEQQHSNSSSQRHPGAEVVTDVPQPQTELEKAKTEVAEQMRHLNELRKKVSESEARNRKAHASLELHGISTANDDGTKNIEEPEPNAMSGAPPEQVEEEVSEGEEESSEDSSSDISSDSSTSDDDSDDGPPEEVTSKHVEPTPNASQAKVCRYFAASGHCRDGDGCAFRHERTEGDQRGTNQFQPSLRQSVQQPPQRREQHVEKQSLYQRLLEQEEEHEDKLALKVIKYLGQAGYFKKAAGGDAV